MTGAEAQVVEQSPTVIAEPLPNRIVCPACGTEQEVVEKRRHPRCVICSKSLPRDGESPSAPPLELVPKPVPNTLAATAASALGDAAPEDTAGGEIEAIRTADKRLTSIFAMIPGWGLWQLSRSAEHTPQQKTALTLASVGLSVLLLLGCWRTLPNAEDRAVAKRVRIETDLRTLSGLARGYAREHGTLPDAAAWQRSAESGDLRFYDPWGRRYRYDANEDGVAIASYGRDDRLGGYGEDADARVIVGVPRQAPAEPATSS